MKQLLFISVLTLQLFLTACSSGSSGSSTGSGVNTNYPHLTSAPQISFSQNVNDPTEYDVTVTLSADGPDGVQLVDLWIFSKDDDTIFEHLDLQFIGGTTWVATTNPFLSLPAGNYYIDSMMVQDADPFDDVVVKSSWYNTGLLSGTHYDADQRITDWDPLSPDFGIIDFTFLVSNIAIVNFTLP